MLALKDIVYYVQDRCLLKIESLKIFDGDRIGIIGRNGVGKSTLLGILAGKIQPETGNVTRYCSCSYIAQLDDAIHLNQGLNHSMVRQFAAKHGYNELMSGGEKTRYRLGIAFSENRPLLLADEPTANLDINGVELLQAELQNYQGAFVIVSHDRQLLNAVCNIIWEISDGRLQPYRGNYSDYLRQKENEQRHQEREYEKYIDQKKHLEQAINDRTARSASTRKTPKRMGNSEARLHKMGNQKARANLDKAVKIMEARLAKLEIKEKPKVVPTINFQLNAADGLYSKVVIRGEKVSKSFGNQVLFNNVDFSIMNGQKVALFGGNGCGKTTLLKMIVERERICVSPASRIGYFTQERNDLNPDQSVITNVMTSSVRDENFVRQLLAQLLFRRDEVFKKVAVLSGGELVRVSLAKIIVSEANVLLLDEPTNYLDLPSLEALEAVLAAYGGTIIFASHDRKFINKIASHLMVFQHGSLRIFAGNCEQYLQESQAQQASKSESFKEERLLLEHRLAEVISRLSVTKDKDELMRLDEEYRSLLIKIK